MELLLALLFAVTFFLAVLRRRSTRRRAPPAIQQIGDPAVAHRSLVENAGAFSDRPPAVFPTSLVIGPGGRRSENVSSVAYGAHWRALRRNLTAETLHPSRLGLLAPLQRRADEALVADLLVSGEGEAVAVRDRLYGAVFPPVARLCFGGSDGRVDEAGVRAMQRVVQDFQGAVGEAINWGSSPLSKLLHWRRWSWLRDFRRRQAELFLPLIAARRRKCRTLNLDGSGGGGIRPYVDSLIDLRVPCTEDGRRELRDDEMASLVSEFLGAATATVAVCVEWTLAYLVNQPEVQSKLRREVQGGDDRSIRDMPYLHAVVLESLRLRPPVPVLLRQVAAGSGSSLVQFDLADIGRHRSTWTDPEVFLPERFLPGGEAEGVGPMPGPKEIRMMPFGAGHRFCPGMGLAMARIKLLVATLVREFEWAPPPAADGAAVDMTERDAFFKLMKTPLVAHIKPVRAS